MVLEQHPALVNVVNKNGKIHREWNLWLQKLVDAINNTETVTVVTQVSPETTQDITFIKGD